MECPHLETSVKLGNIREHVSLKKRKKRDRRYKRKTAKSPAAQPIWACSGCKTDKKPWICLACGVINCGRYVSGHALQHFSQHSQHTVCMNCEDLSVFCYSCDDFIFNDTSSNQIEHLRGQLKRLLNHGDQKKRRASECDDSSTNNNKRQKKARLSVIPSSQRSSGLRNLGNTCFMNVVLQSLSSIHPFCGYFKNLKPLEEDVSCRRNGIHFEVAEEVRKVLVELWQSKQSAISPDSLFAVICKVVPKFRGYVQHDAHEFLRYMLDQLHVELLSVALGLNSNKHDDSYNVSKAKSTIVSNIFGGTLQSEVKCLICKNESKKHDPFLDLSLDIPESNGNPKSASISTIAECLSSFTDLEELAETELYYCSNCKLKQRSTKKFWLRRLPNVLCLHLKRFRWTAVSEREKIDSFVEFPVMGLNMGSFLLDSMPETRGSGSTSNVYDLNTVIVHHGNGSGSGHYTAYSHYSGMWFHFNDHSVKIVDVEDVKSCHAYILFYVRRGDDKKCCLT